MSAGSAGTRAPVVGGYKDRLKAFAHGALDPVVGALARAGLSPDALTILGLLLSIAAGVEFFRGEHRIAAGILIVAGLCDILDGQVARVTGNVTRFGAFLDSTLDRLAESFVLVGLAGFYASNLLGLYAKAGELLRQVGMGELDLPGALFLHANPPSHVDPRAWVALTMTAMLALTGSFMVSYTRARAEGLGLECKVGWFERPERIVLLIIAGLVGTFFAMSLALLLLTILSFFTAAQRMAHVWKITRPARSHTDHTEA